jgi:hypothetical protein
MSRCLQPLSLKYKVGTSYPLGLAQVSFLIALV